MGFSIWQLAIVLGIVILLFGTKKLRNVGGDMGSAISSFKKAMKNGAADVDATTDTKLESNSTTAIEADVIPAEKGQA